MRTLTYHWTRAGRAAGRANPVGAAGARLCHDIQRPPMAATVRAADHDGHGRRDPGRNQCAVMESYALGDWQTPPTLAREIVDALRRYGFTWSRVLEPTCGVGNFVEAVITDPAPQEVIGVDIQSRYIKTARQRFADAEKATLNFLGADFFALDLDHDIVWDSSGPLLVLGNPPWVTNAAISARGDNRRRVCCGGLTSRPFSLASIDTRCLKTRPLHSQPPPSPASGWETETSTDSVHRPVR